MRETIVPGRYRHYKGRDYEIYSVAKHSETLEEVVVYRALYGSFDLWVRPIEMFYQSVHVNGDEIPRFSLIEKKDDLSSDALLR